MRLGIDATNLGLGGGITHLIEFLNQTTILAKNSSFEKIIIFSSKKILDQLPNSDLFEKLTFPNLNKGLVERIIFHFFSFDKEIKKRCDILFSITGDYIGRFQPVVGMSRNMLLYERNIWKEIKQPKEIIRFWINYHKQRRSFKNSLGIIFISKYAFDFVSKQINLDNKLIAIIHHGVSNRFRGQVKPQLPITNYSLQNPFRLLYVSTVHIYKHQWNVVSAIENLKKKGYPIELSLVGEVIFKSAGDRLFKVMNNADPKGTYIHYHDHIPYENISEYYNNADGIVYASTCENMPNILIESMSSGIPIACSDKQPMPEFLKANGFYFDSYDIISIENSVEEMLINNNAREIMAKNNLIESGIYSWDATTRDTLQFIEQIFDTYYHR
jgi:glycosyltransferase involved in cell wall biosynthesis